MGYKLRIFQFATFTIHIKLSLNKTTALLYYNKYQLCLNTPKNSELSLSLICNLSLVTGKAKNANDVS